ncbi:hypothetical protein Cni_G02699 [Canna indica]|uniref:Uncharacterized protein n=1 Tax=Canna indica TaxID=4628 RepID=A0AAQ3Q0K7_9LILI|nr:hypothetical protein Cni_G02699 [Canna indica]
MAAIGWYGPLIDLARAGSHVEDLVQLLVFVHSQPVAVQKSNTSNGGTILKTKILASDDTRTNFSVSIWPKHMGSVIAAGDVLLLQNVKIIKFRDSLEATTVQVSLLHTVVRSCEVDAFGGTSLLPLSSKVHVFLLPISIDGKPWHHAKFVLHLIWVTKGQATNRFFSSCRGVDKLLSNIKLVVGRTTKEKLKRVLDWIWHTESALQHVRKVDTSQVKIMNWKAVEEKNAKICSSISELLAINDLCNVKLYASIGELLPASWISSEVENNFVSYNSLVKMVDIKILQYLIGTGCKLCGSSLVSRSRMEKNRIPLYCQNSSNYVHKVGIIYRPFILKVWDKTAQITILVKNKAAEILFGNITAEMVHTCYLKESEKHSNYWHVSDAGNSPFLSHKRPKSNESRKKIHLIWLITLKLLLQQGEKNSPFQFEITVNTEKDIEAGRFELISITMPPALN